MKQLLFFFFLFFCGFNTVYAQVRQISGRVTDAQTGEAMPFVNIYFKNSTIGTTTNFEGNYILKAVPPTDSLTVSYVGYQTRSKKITNAASQVVNFQLVVSSQKLGEVVIRPTENPAFALMRKVVKRKKGNDRENLTAFQYEAYNKIELDIDNLSGGFKKKKIPGPIAAILDSIKLIAGEDGNPVLPVFISETLSDYYFLKDPKKIKENIKASKVTGIGINDASFVTQLLGSAFQSYNFYDNWMPLLGKNFISPIADGWKLYYDYDLEDSLFIGNTWCYKLKVIPLREQDLAFNGTIWITDTTFALRQVDLAISKQANLNFVDNVKIQQEFKPTSAGPWLPVKTRLLIDIAEVGDDRPGMLAKIYTSSRDVTVNQPLESEFYDSRVEVSEKALKHTDDFWKENRHDSLSATEIHVYSMIDSVKNLPVVKTYVEVIDILVNGHKRIGKISIGPYSHLYARNRVEGNRFQLGFKTNAAFSHKMVLGGYLAYGTRDKDFKYGANAKFILSRSIWSEAGISYRNDLQQVGINPDRIENSGLFLLSTRFGRYRQAFKQEEVSAYIQREVLKGLTERFTVRKRSFEPLFPFAYQKNENKDAPQYGSNFETTELILDTKYANNEIFLDTPTDRVSLGNRGWPMLRLRYLIGIKNALGSDIAYQHVEIGLKQTIPMGVLGKGVYDMEAGHLFGRVPYPLLEVHLGNETPFYNRRAFNLMNFFEFASDTYASIHYDQYFEGLGLNSIPLIKKLKWRGVATANVLYGKLSNKNQDFKNIPGFEVRENDFKEFGNLPYAEIGYGFENIFRFLRVQAFHRLTYRKAPGVDNFGIKIGAQFKL